MTILAQHTTKIGHDRGKGKVDKEHNINNGSRAHSSSFPAASVLVKLARSVQNVRFGLALAARRSPLAFPSARRFFWLRFGCDMMMRFNKRHCDAVESTEVVQYSCRKEAEDGRYERIALLLL